MVSLAVAGIDDSPRKGKPCPACGGRDRFTLFPNGRHFCRGCGGGDAIDLIQKVYGCGFKEAQEIGGGIVSKSAPVLASRKEPDPTAKIERARQIIAQSKMLHPESEAWRYLVETRKLPVELLGFELRCIDRLPYYEQDADGKPVITGHYAAMVAPIRSQAGEIIAVHLTYLLAGQKAPVASPRKIIGSPKGGAIRLCLAGDEVGLAEGIETAIAARALFDKPVWSCLSASLAESVELPDHIRRVHFYADADEAGRKAAVAFMRRAKQQNRTPGECKSPGALGDFYDSYLEVISGEDNTTI